MDFHTKGADHTIYKFASFFLMLWNPLFSNTLKHRTKLRHMFNSHDLIRRKGCNFLFWLILEIIFLFFPWKYQKQKDSAPQSALENWNDNRQKNRLITAGFGAVTFFLYSKYWKLFFYKSFPWHHWVQNEAQCSSIKQNSKINKLLIQPAVQISWYIAMKIMSNAFEC